MQWKFILCRTLLDFVFNFYFEIIIYSQEVARETDRQIEGGLKYTLLNVL